MPQKIVLRCHWVRPYRKGNELKLPLERFKAVLQDAVLVSLDLLIVNERNEILLGKRCNSPAKGFFFVPGGRIYKSESPETALARISRNEIGFQLDSRDAIFHGIYHHTYSDNCFADPEICSTEYLVIASIFRLDPSRVPIHDGQHECLRFFPINTLASDPEVHEFAKDYVRDRPASLFLGAQSPILIGHAR